ncbi:YceI family protein [Hymenobacter perfusus]|uniref:YceI family protein n=1 Tax=Hymenobacter perfusus TaxID=1236770 RepID=A0A3R9MHL0_9BACT|nr:YceI family protein [Hymenobacter perfusus]RSK42380.1 YceI family protein [Hymenobacter perfusus]
MKVLLALLLICALAAARPATDTYQINPAASRVTWTGYAEVGSYAPSGTVQLRRGTFAYDGRTLRAGRFEFDMRTIEQEQAQLAEHLRGPDFFDVATHPTAVFVLSEVRAGRASGQLTLRGITKPVQFPLTLTPLPGGPLRATGTVTLDRTQFGINHNSSSFFQNLGSYAIRNEFTLAFDVVATRQ